MLPRMTEGLTRSTLRKLENAEAFPLIALQAAREVRTELDELEAEAILRARELGASLEDIADAMGITRQGVAYRLKHMNGSGHDEVEDVVDLSAEESERPGIP
jgi:DNA-directed RNA polymerase specialized sigma24 family protein